MFDLKNFVMKTINKMIFSNEVAEYKVMQYALSYYDKEIITDEDMEQIAAWIDERDNPPQIVDELPKAVGGEDDSFFEA